jgi:hypothetical protein
VSKVANSNFSCGDNKMIYNHDRIIKNYQNEKSPCNEKIGIKIAMAKIKTAYEP